MNKGSEKNGQCFNQKATSEHRCEWVCGITLATAKSFFLSRIAFSVSVVTFFYPHGLTKTIKMCVNCSPAGSRFAGVFWGAWLRWSFLFPRIQGMDA